MANVRFNNSLHLDEIDDGQFRVDTPANKASSQMGGGGARRKK